MIESSKSFTPRHDVGARVLVKSGYRLPHPRSELPAFVQDYNFGAILEDNFGVIVGRTLIWGSAEYAVDLDGGLGVVTVIESAIRETVTSCLISGVRG